MANAIKFPVIVLDTFSSAINLGDSLFGDSNAPFICSIRWIEPTTVGHTAIVTDGAGNTIFEDMCATAKTGNFASGRLRVRGIKIAASAVGSGKIIIEVE